jgi:hypothetical protein
VALGDLLRVKNFIEVAEVWPEGSAFSWRAYRTVITGHQAPAHCDESIRAGAIYSVRLQLTIFPGEYSFSVAIGDSVPDNPHCGLLHDNHFDLSPLVYWTEDRFSFFSMFGFDVQFREDHRLGSLTGRGRPVPIRAPVSAPTLL